MGIWNGARNTFTYWGTGDERWELTTYDNAAEFTAEVAIDTNANGFLSCRLISHGLA